MSLESLDAALPPTLGIFPGVFLTGRYVLSRSSDSHAGNGLKAVPLPDGRVAAAVADTGFRGTPAAIATARLMAVLRGQLESGAALGEALEAVDRYAANSPFGTGATMVVALIDQETGEAEVGAAGHAPPILVPARGEPRSLALTPSRPLGLGGRASLTRCHLERDGALVLFTDGLVTARDGAVLDGADRLKQTIASLSLSGRSGPAYGDALSGNVLSAMQKPTGYVDDVALLVAQRAAPGPPFHAVCAPDALTPATATALFTAWLDTLGVGLMDHVALSNAMSEIAEAMAVPPVPHDQRAEGSFASPPPRPGRRLPVEIRASLTADGHLEVGLCVPIQWQPESRVQQRALVMAGGLVESLALHQRQDATEVVLRQIAGRPVPVLVSGAASQRTGETIPYRAPKAGFGHHREGALVSFTGAIGVEQEDEFRELVHEATWAGTRSTQIDLSDVTRLSGPAVRVLFDYLDRAASSEARFAVMTGAGSAADQVLTQAALPHRTG